LITRLIRVTILVRDQDEALRFYTEKLGFEKRADVTFGPAMRWLTVAPAGQRDIEIVLRKPEVAMHGEENARQMLEMVGQGTTWVFACEDCRATYAELRGRGVTFTSEPQEQPYGVEAVFRDLYGNSFSLLQPHPAEAGLWEGGDPAQTHPAARSDAASGTKDAVALTLRAARAELDAAAAEVGEGRMTEPRATGT
jgi:predicted enzyme related to lactoylglutathione lyase